MEEQFTLREGESKTALPNLLAISSHAARSLLPLPAHSPPKAARA